MLKLQQISNWWLSEQLTSLCHVERSWLFVVLCFFVRHQDCERMSWNNEVIIRLCWIILFWRKVRPNMKASFTTLTPQDFNITIAIFLWTRGLRSWWLFKICLKLSANTSMHVFPWRFMKYITVLYNCMSLGFWGSHRSEHSGERPNGTGGVWDLHPNQSTNLE